MLGARKPIVPFGYTAPLSGAGDLGGVVVVVGKTTALALCRGTAAGGGP